MVIKLIFSFILLSLSCALADSSQVFLKAKLIGFTKDKIEFETVQKKRFLIERSRIPNIDQWVVGKAMIQVPLSLSEIEALYQSKTAN